MWIAFESCDVKDGYCKGKKLDESGSPWLGVEVFLNQDEIMRRETGATGFEPRYVGYRNI